MIKIRNIFTGFDCLSMLWIQQTLIQPLILLTFVIYNDVRWVCQTYVNPFWPYKCQWAVVNKGLDKTKRDTFLNSVTCPDSEIANLFYNCDEWFAWKLACKQGTWKYVFLAGILVRKMEFRTRNSEKTILTTINNHCMTRHDI